MGKTYVISEQQLDTIMGKYNPNDFEYYRNLAKPYEYKRQFLKHHPKEYYLAKKGGVLDDLKVWKVKNNISNLLSKKISEQQYELYQKTNNYPDDKTPVEGEIVWRALAKANDKLGEALRLVQMCIQYSNEYPGLERQLIQISQDISCGSNNVIECGPDSSDVMGQINDILKQMGYIKRDNVQSNTIG
jgi:hypothetical protein